MGILNLAVCVMLILLLGAVLAAMTLDLLGVRDRAPQGSLEDWSTEPAPAGEGEPPGLTSLRYPSAAVARLRFVRGGAAVHERSLYAEEEIHLGTAEDEVLSEDVALRSVAVRWQQGQPWFMALDSTGPPRYRVDGQERQITAHQWIPWLSGAELELGGCRIAWEPYRSDPSPGGTRALEGGSPA